MNTHEGLKESLRRMPDEKIIDVFSRIPLMTEDTRQKVLSITLQTDQGVCKPKEVAGIIREGLLEKADTIDFSKVGSLMENLPVLLFYFGNFSEAKKSLAEYLDGAGIDKKTLQPIDLTTLSNLAFAITDFPFITPEIIFNSKIEEFIELYHKIREVHPKFDPYGAHRTKAFDLAKAIQYLLDCHKARSDLSKIMKKVERIEEIDADFAEGKADVTSLV